MGATLISFYGQKDGPRSTEYEACLTRKCRRTTLGCSGTGSSCPMDGDKLRWSSTQRRYVVAASYRIQTVSTSLVIASLCVYQSRLSRSSLDWNWTMLVPLIHFPPVPRLTTPPARAQTHHAPCPRSCLLSNPQHPPNSKMTADKKTSV
jgi:hypothetical protein